MLRPLGTGAYPKVGTSHQLQNGVTVVGYIRVSTNEQSIGSDAQHAALENWCATRDGATVQPAGGAAQGDSPEALLMRRIVDALVHVDTIVATYCCLLLIC